jgi:glycosyltransferase involved in cell wall biosynthesis
MEISILHPSFKRPALARACYGLWTEKLYKKDDREYILCLSEKDPTIEEYKRLFKDTIVTLVYHEDNGWVKQLNKAAEHSTGNWLVCIGDDFDCPVHWDEQLMEYLVDKEDVIVKTQDGVQSWIMTLPLMDRKYYSRFGYIVHPEYMHMFGDTWLTHIADLIGRVVNIPVLFPHNHYTTGKMKRDEVNVANDKTWMQGELLYIKHVKNNFGLVSEQILGKLNCHKEHIGWLKQRGVTI